MHTNIFGSTGFGKSTYAVKMARVAARVGRPIGVIDPMVEQHGRWPDGAMVTTDLGEFEQWAKEQLNAFLFIDEGHDSIGTSRWQEDLHWLFRYGRHYGHRVSVMTQYPMDLPPVVRMNCRHVVCFNIDGDSAYKLSRVYRCPVLYDAPTLKEMEFIYVERGNNDAPSRQTMTWEY